MIRQPLAPLLSSSRGAARPLSPMPIQPLGPYLPADAGPMSSPGAPAAAAPARPVDPPSAGMTPERERLATAILNATGGGQQPVESPWQALGNASQQMAAAYIEKKKKQQPQQPRQPRQLTQGRPSMWGSSPAGSLSPIRAARPSQRFSPRATYVAKQPGG